MAEMEATHNAATTELRATHQEAIEATRSELEDKVLLAEKTLGDTVAALESHQEKAKAMEAELSAARSAAEQAAATVSVAKTASIGADDLGLMGEFETVESVLAAEDELREVNSKL
eukprot:COSAG04_NODE_21282_length_376_cov_1.108303_1_plen_115_part_01